MLIPAAITEARFNLLPKSQNFTSRIDCATGNTRKGVRLIATLFEKSPANACSIRPATVLDSVKQVADHTQHLAKLTHLGNEVAEIPF